ncbi:MAG TPA: N-methyl-L-tryptophan oxidase [Oculatellaceae cyanobacterium]
MARHYDAIVVGLGAMGSASCYQLALRGLNVLGIDRHEPPHSFGSSHGESRVMRLAIGEGEHYTPLALRSYELFKQIEKEANCNLLETTGMLTISSTDKTLIESEADFFDNTVAAAKRFGVKHDLLDAAEVRSRFPQFSIADSERAYYEYAAGYLNPEECIRAQLELARKAGASVQAPESLISFREEKSGVQVETDRATYSAKSLVLAAGPWLPNFLPNALEKLFKVYRMTVSWFDVADVYEQFKPGAFPVFFWQLPGYDKWIYGFPAYDGPDKGLKIAATDDFAVVNPDKVETTVSSSEIEDAYNKYIAPCLPAVRRKTMRSSMCMITATPDSEFVLDYLPGTSRTLAVSACSGHGFKHSAAIGECVASLVETGRSELDYSHFSFERFANKCNGSI